MKKLILWDPPFSSTKKADLFHQVCEFLVKEKLISDSKTVFKSLIWREKAGNTLISQSLAVPHVQSASVNQALLLFIHLKEPILNWCNKNNANRFIFIMLPEAATQEDLIIMKKFFIKLADDKVINKLCQGTQQEIEQFIRR